MIGLSPRHLDAQQLPKDLLAALKRTEDFMNMSTANSIEAAFAAGPARDSRFDVKERWAECLNLPDDHQDRGLEFFHRQMNEEINGMENAARNLADFPDAEWTVRMSIARQAADEARHVLMFRRILERRGGWLGRYPVLNFQYRIITKIDNLVGRLAVQNRSFEAEGVDAVEPEIQKARERGDSELADLYEAQLADEIGHVRFANEYIAQSTKGNPLNVMRVGRALNQAGEAFLWVMGQQAVDSVKYTTNERGRLEAGFSPEEVAFAAAERSARRTHGGA
jgi:uncharacterized ferritin-like protein (DUF455 family)